MARSRNHSSNGSPSPSVGSLLELIIADVIATQTMSTKDWWAQNSNDPLVSMAIPTANRREYRVTQKGIDAAHSLTQQTWDKRESLRQLTERKRFDQISFTAIGETIAGAKALFRVGDGEKDDDAAFWTTLAAEYDRNLDRLSQATRGDTDRHIPCHLFDADQRVESFSIGPVCFLPREDWVARFVSEPAVADIVRAVGCGDRSADALREEALALGSKEVVFQAWEIVAFLRRYGWVATIRLIDHESGRSQQKASILIGLAIDALGLRFQAGDATRFAKSDRAQLVGDIRFATTLSGKVLHGSTFHRAGLGSAPGKLAAKVLGERLWLDAAGAVLAAYVSARQSGRAAHIIERWANALYWVGEARREPSDFMAVVHYGCALDGLTGAGGSIKPMTDFAEAALAPAPESAGGAGVPIAEAVRPVYAEGRNKLAHGEMPELLEDLGDVRRLGDDLLVHLFDRVTLDLAEAIVTTPLKLDIPSDHAIRG